MTVIDGSLLVAALVDSGRDGQWAEGVIATDELAGPELTLVETSDVLRRLERARRISRFEAEGAYRDMLRLDVELFPFSPFANRVWELRDNLTGYDAWYVAVAEALDCPLATLDRKLRSAVGPLCEIIVPPN